MPITHFFFSKVSGFFVIFFEHCGLNRRLKISVILAQLLINTEGVYIGYKSLYVFKAKNLILHF
jgi:hypothetical protein